MTKVNLTYFKPSGKFYDRAEYESKYQLPFEIFTEVHNWFAFHDFESLPGRNTQFWDGYILVELPDMHPPALIDLCYENSD